MKVDIFISGKAIRAWHLLSYSQLPYDSHFAAIFDCCHSGGMTREGARKARGITPPDDIRHRALRWNAELQMWEDRPYASPNPSPIIRHKSNVKTVRAELVNPMTVRAELVEAQVSTHHRIGRAISLRSMAKKQYDATRKTLKHHGPYLPIILEACQEEQLSYEYRHGAQSYGAFTYSLAATLRASRGKKVNPSFVRLMDGVEERLKKLKYPQVVSGPIESDRNFYWGGLMKNIINAVTVLLLATLLSGCGTLPDAKPFADATSALSVAVKTSGQAVSDSLRDAGGAMPGEESKKYEAYADELQKAWGDRVMAMQGAVTYAEAIADLVAAGNNGGATAKKVGDSLSALAAATNIPIASPVVGVISDIGKFIAERIAIVNASKTLEEAVAQAQPAVDKIAEQLAQDTTSKLKPILVNAYKNTISGIKTQYDADDNFAQQIGTKRDKYRKDALADQKNIPSLIEFDRMQETVSQKIKERNQKIEQAASTYKVRLQLVGTLSTAVTTWGTAHRDLANAIREKRKVTVTELQETVSDLKGLIKEVRAL